MWQKSICVLAALAGWESLAAADISGLSVTPGRWESTSEIIISVVGEDGVETELETRTEISQSCITPQDHVLDAVELAGPGCSVSDIWVSEPDMSFVLVCRRSEMTFYGTMVASAGEEGRTTMGRMTLKGRHDDGSELHIRADMTGAHTGPCVG